VEYHVEALARVIRTQGTVEPIKVVQIGDEVAVIDGHHRVAAYSRAGVTSNIPVVFFEGTLEEAVLEAGRSNSQAKLQMDNRERQDFAWRLVRMGYKKKDVVATAVVSDGQVAIMRRVLKKLGSTADDYPRWFRAHKAAHGKDDPNLTRPTSPRQPAPKRPRARWRRGRRGSQANLGPPVGLPSSEPRFHSDLRSSSPVALLSVRLVDLIG